MGCGTYSYWLGNLLADYFMFIITVAINYMLPYLLDMDYFFINSGKNFTFIFLTLGFGLGMITFSYVYGFLFEDASTAYKIYPFCFISVTLGLPFVLVEMVANLSEYNIFT